MRKGGYFVPQSLHHCFTKHTPIALPSLHQALPYRFTIALPSLYHRFTKHSPIASLSLPVPAGHSPP